MNRKWIIVWIGIAALLGDASRAFSAAGMGHDFRLTLAPATASVTKKTLSKNYAYSLPVGFGSELSYFLTKNTALAAQFEMNLDMGTQSVALLGGGVGISYYLIGGARQSYEDNLLQLDSQPKFDAAFLFGIGSKTFDFAAIDAKQTPAESDTIEVKDKKDIASGNVMGLCLGLGSGYSVTDYYSAGLRVQMFNSFTYELSPSITSMSVWITNTVLW